MTARRLVTITVAALLGIALFASTQSSAENQTKALGGPYTGPGTKGVVGAQSFDRVMGTVTTSALDFPPTDSWSQIEGQSWLLVPHGLQTKVRFEYSLPIVPSINGASLQQCAAGLYTSHWAKLAHNLISFKLSNAIIRPGWEMNGSWYRWSAARDPQSYIACFRNVVTTMRAVQGGHFSFDWNVNNGDGAMDATHAYPGDQFVDIIGVDAYDYSWNNYRVTAKVSDAQAATTRYNFHGSHGLLMWANFARLHYKPVSLTEWGLLYDVHGHGGGDNPGYVTAIHDFIVDPANHVINQHYFNSGNSAYDHRLTGTTVFPVAAEQFKRLFG